MAARIVRYQEFHLPRERGESVAPLCGVCHNSLSNSYTLIVHNHYYSRT